MKLYLAFPTIFFLLIPSICSAAGGELEFSVTLPSDLVSDGRVWKGGRYRFVVNDWNTCKLLGLRIDNLQFPNNKLKMQEVIHGICGFAKLGADAPSVSVLATIDSDRTIVMFETPDHKIQQARVVYLKFRKADQ